MTDLLQTPVGGIPVGVYALIGLTTGILAYTTLADETGEPVADNTANVLPTLNLFNDDNDGAAEQSGGRKRKKHRKTPKKHGGRSRKTAKKIE